MIFFFTHHTTANPPLANLLVSHLPNLHGVKDCFERNESQWLLMTDRTTIEDSVMKLYDIGISSRLKEKRSIRRHIVGTTEGFGGMRDRDA